LGAAGRGGTGAAAISGRVICDATLIEH
jgi:hypothetical protein